MKHDSYEEMQREYAPYSLKWIGYDISNKFALISLVGYLVTTIQKKKPNITFYQTIHQLAKGILSDNDSKRLAVVCEDFAYGCKEFPTFGIEAKNIPAKIQELIKIQLPF